MKTSSIKIGAVDYRFKENLTTLGYDFLRAFEGFKRERKIWTSENFCRYIKQIDPRFICVPA